MSKRTHLNMVEQKDCLEFLKGFQTLSVDHVFTSPPYNRKRNDKYDHYSDIVDDYYSFIRDVIVESMRITKKYVFINIQKTYYNKVDVFKLMGEFANNIQEVLIWEKSNPMPANGLNITNAYEFFIVLGNESLKSNDTYTKNIITTSVHSDMPKNHKAVMKPEVADWFIDNFTQFGDIVVDPFAGYGTTGLSCVNKGRLFIGSDISDVYSKEANERLDNAYYEYGLKLTKDGFPTKIIDKSSNFFE